MAQYWTYMACGTLNDSVHLILWHTWHTWQIRHTWHIYQTWHTCHDYHLYTLVYFSTLTIIARRGNLWHNYRNIEHAWHNLEQSWHNIEHGWHNSEHTINFPFTLWHYIYMYYHNIEHGWHNIDPIYHSMAHTWFYDHKYFIKKTWYHRKKNILPLLMIDSYDTWYVHAKNLF